MPLLEEEGVTDGETWGESGQNEAEIELLISIYISLLLIKCENKALRKYPSAYLV